MITGLAASKIADRSVSNTKFQYLSGVTSDIQTQLDAKQATGNFITSFILNELLFGNGTSAIGSVTKTSTPSILLSTNVTGAPTWTTSTAGNFLQGGVSGVTFGPITNISPGGDFTLSQNSVNSFVSEQSGAVANTLYLKAGKVGIGTSNPTAAPTLGSGQILAPDGTSANPSYSFSSSSGTGMTYTAGNGTVFQTAGTTSFALYSRSFRLPASAYFASTTKGQKNIMKGE